MELLQNGDARRSSRRAGIRSCALALALRPLRQGQAKIARTRAAARWCCSRPRYVEALREFSRDAVAPDANGTLRVTYGTVRGYRPTPDAPRYRPFTTVSEIVAEEHRQGAVRRAASGCSTRSRAKKFGPYADPALGEVPVDFLADLDITGGNSGSATLNARGELDRPGLRRQLRGDGLRLALHAGDHAHHPRRHPLRALGDGRGRRRRPPARGDGRRARAGVTGWVAFSRRPFRRRSECSHPWVHKCRASAAA